MSNPEYFLYISFVVYIDDILSTYKLSSIDKTTPLLYYNLNTVIQS